jgi:hypothetical protein
MKPVKNLFLPALLTFFMITGCNDEENQIARLRITLVDDPGDYQAVNVDIQGVAVHPNVHATDNSNGWIILDNSNVGVKNLLNYTGGVELTLADTDFPAGRLSQIRLLLGEDNSVIIDNVKIPLETPSAEQSGLKLAVHETLKGGITYEFKLDFEAALSVVQTGDGDYILKPVINIFTKALSGSIKGSVIPASENVALYVMNGEEVVSSTYAPEGVAEFLFADVPEGIYTISINPGKASLLPDISINNINVDLGNVTDLGEIDLNPI